jgi:hypothetical protein
MADAAGRVRARRWYLRAGRAAGAGLIGAAVGAVVASIWHAGWEAAGNACPEPNYSSVLCFPVLQVGSAVLGSGLVIGAGVCLGFLLLRVRPSQVTIPVGCVLAAVLIWAVGSDIPGGTPPAAWTTALAAGAGLTSLALIVDTGRVQIAGIIALVVVLVGAFAAPRLIHARIQQDARDRQLAALGFPLMLPAAAGYHADGAYAVNGGLSVSMASDTPGKSLLSRGPVLTVTITPDATTGPGGKPVDCQYLGPHQRCRELKPALWLVPRPGDPEVITWRGGVEIDATSLGYAPVSVNTLVQAATNLHPASAAALASLDS